MSKAGVQLPGVSFRFTAHTVGDSVAFISHITRLRYIYCFENLHYPRHESLRRLFVVYVQRTPRDGST